VTIMWLKAKHSGMLPVFFALAVIAVLIAIEPSAALAANAGGGAAGGGAANAADPFGTLLQTVKSWATGSLGKLIAVIALVVGGMAGVMGSMRVALAAFGLAIIIAFGPAIIDLIFNTAVAT